MTFLSRRLRSFALPALAFVVGACSSADNLVAPKSSPSTLEPAYTAYVGGAATVVISQVYGGGGNAGSVWRNDFIELYNATTSPVNLAGWSVQYASSTGNSWAVTPLTGTLQPGQYYLVQQAAQGGGTTSLPTPDATGTIAMAAGAGKVALVSSTTALSGTGGSGALTGASCPSPIPSTLVDFVGYGTASTCAEVAPTGTIAATSSAVRGNGGKTDANNNAADFAVTTTIVPRNTASPINPVTPQNPVASVAVTPATGTVQVGATTPFTAIATDASNNPTGTTITWSSSNIAVATIDPATGVATGVSVGTVTITATAANNIAGSATLGVTAGGGTPPVTLPAVRFSEVHYDNADTDVGEGIELEAPAGTDLTGWRVQLYNGNGGALYSDRLLSGIVASQCDGRGVVVLEYPANGLQNGGTGTTAEPDGMALLDASGMVVEFLSYEGVMTATIGTVSVTSVNIGAAQNGAPLGTSLQRSLTGDWASAPSNFYGCNGRTPGRQIITTSIAISGRNNDAPLPVGFEGQIFATVRNGSTPVPFVWSSDTPNIATIDQDGVITAVAAGQATFRATTTDGMNTATYTLPMVDGVASTTAQYAGNTEFGRPADGNTSDDLIIERTEYTSSFNTTRNTPNWVSYNLEQTHLQVGADRCNCFTYDPELPAAGRYTTNEYTGVGDIYNRGHLVRSADRTTGSLDNARTYYFSNIIPQAADNNQGPWAAFETYLGGLVTAGDKEVYIVTGVAGNIGTLKNEGDVVIPENVWKVAVIMPRNQGLANLTSLESAEVIAVIMPNVNGIRNEPWQGYRTTVDAVEALSGYDLLALIRDDLETAIESNTKPPVASTNGPFEGIVGSTFSMSAATSTDADGDALTFRWSFGDGAMATGVNVTHTYVTSGVFNVRLIARDTRGLEDTTFTTATVLSASQVVGRAITQVTALETAGTFDQGIANSIRVKLRAALKQVEQRNVAAASGILGAVVNELDAMVQSGRVSEADIASLRALVQQSIGALGA